jgi:hypothetical protein
MRDRHHGLPTVAQHIQTDFALEIYVWVIDWSRLKTTRLEPNKKRDFLSFFRSFFAFFAFFLLSRSNVSSNATQTPKSSKRTHNQTLIRRHFVDLTFNTMAGGLCGYSSGTEALNTYVAFFQYPSCGVTLIRNTDVS